MEIAGKVHCLFEQSGTFKKAFLKNGILALDYDIQNMFGETDVIIDLFREIEKCFIGQDSIFDTFTENDLVIAFFPCIYFSAQSQVAFSWNCRNYRNRSGKEKAEIIIERDRNRSYYFQLAVKLYSIMIEKGIRMVMENPWTQPSYLNNNFVVKPSLIDTDRSKRGDFFKKPTAYWFVNCNPSHGFSLFSSKRKAKYKIKDMQKSPKAGICSEERSMISEEYAENFISEFILGKNGSYIEGELF